MKNMEENVPENGSHMYKCSQVGEHESQIMKNLLCQTKTLS